MPNFLSLLMSRSLLSFLSAFIAISHLTLASEFHYEPDKVFQFLSRPEIKAPKWKIKTHLPDLSSPGYWFTAPYETLAVHSEFHGFGWVGPHIYDKTGELVWSGSAEFDGANVMDFRVSKVNGKDMITVVDRDQGSGIVVDEKYDVQQVVKMENSPGQINAHEFYFVDNGTRVLMLKNEKKKASEADSKKIGYNGNCVAHYVVFTELDTETWNQTFNWDSYDHIDLDESTFIQPKPEDFCSGHGMGWDFLHSNSVDKNEDGDYILSGRHTNTLYKIDGRDGKILWRLEGYRDRSDFEMVNLKFSRQHNVRWQGRNDTHSFISFLDNAWGEDGQQPSFQHSRGLLIALDEKNMIATLEQAYDHPDGNGGFADKRGNMEILPNGNVYMGWSHLARHSEHTPDGEIIIEATLQAEWLGSYRGYLLDWIGRPATLPALHSAAYGAEDDTVDTHVHVSWNGATEVASWKLYKTTSEGEHSEPVTSASKTGFETRVQYDGYASYVYAEALDKGGNVLSRSGVHKTITHPNVTAHLIAQEREWLQKAWSQEPPNEEETFPEVAHQAPAPLEQAAQEEEPYEEESYQAASCFSSSTAMFVFGLALGMTLLSVAWLFSSRWRSLLRRKSQKYDALSDSQFELGEDEDETMVMEGSSLFEEDRDVLKEGHISPEREKLREGV